MPGRRLFQYHASQAMQARNTGPRPSSMYFSIVSRAGLARSALSEAYAQILVLKFQLARNRIETALHRDAHESLQQRPRERPGEEAGQLEFVGPHDTRAGIRRDEM